MYCQRCNAVLPVDAKFCAQCGAVVEQVAMQRVYIPEDIAKRTQGFAGRLWVLNEVSDWLNHGSERFLLITGEPGSGKTALAAWLAGARPAPEDAGAQNKLEHVRNAWRAAHFCVARGQGGTLNPNRFAQALVTQLSDTYENYAAAVLQRVAPEVHIDISVRENRGQIVGAQIGPLIINSNPQDVYNRSVREPLEVLFGSQPGLRVFIVVDGLDEALSFGSSNIITLLAGSYDLPANVRFLLTSRNEPKVIAQFEQKRHLNLTDPTHAHDVNRDLRTYVDQRLKEDKLQQRLAAAGSPPGVGDRVVEQAAGNFLYAKFLLDEIADAKRSPTNLADLPRELYELYRSFLDRLMPEMLQTGTSSRWKGQFRPLLGCMSVG